FHELRLYPLSRPRGKHVRLDEVAQGILFELQKDARNTTIAEIANRVEVSSTTVRNRIDEMESMGVIEGYRPEIDYEVAGFPLNVLFICHSSAADRELDEGLLSVPGVVSAQEMLTDNRDVHVEAVASDTDALATITDKLTEYGLEIVTSEIVSNHYVSPWGHFEYQA
ncbi:MAG: Lrp/AsnC family transcriptional regulator, partial [Haloarculaceae archaeon]